MEPVIVIGGGVGPMAGVAMHARIIEHTLAPDGDASHLTVHHFSRSAAIPDRTAWLQALAKNGRAGINPGIAMAEVFASAARSLNYGEQAVGGVPCNTFHAPAIFDVFAAELAARGNPVRLLHMLDETVRLLEERLPGQKGRIGVLSTTGTRACGVYDALLAKAGYEAVYVGMEHQELLHQSIYHPDWGIKSASPVSARAQEVVEQMADRLANDGVIALLPACTELPLALPGAMFGTVPLVDPVTALARGLIREAAPEKLRPLA